MTDAGEGGTPTASLRGRIGIGGLWLTGTRALVNLLSLLSTFILARLLVPADFGLVAIGTTMLVVVRSITDVAMSQALVHHPDPTDTHMHTAWTLSALRGTIVGGVFAACGPLIGHFFNDPRLAMLIYALGFSLFITGLTNPRRVLLQKKLIYRQEFLLSVAERVINVAVTLGIAYFYRSYWAIVIGMVVSQAAQTLLSYTSIPYLPRFSLRHSRELWSFSMWLTLTQLLNTLNFRLDGLLVGKMLSPAALGIYTLGNNLATMPTRESMTPISRTLYPAFATIRDDPERLRQAYQRAQMMMTAIALPIGVTVALNAHTLVLLLLGHKWLDATIVVQVISIVAAVQTMGTLAQALAMSNGQTRLLFLRSVQLFLSRIPLVVIGLYLDGLRGLVIARFLSGMTGMVANMRIVRELCGLGVISQFRANARTFGAIIMMAVVGVALQAVLPDVRSILWLIAEMGFCILVQLSVYVGVMALLWHMQGRPAGAEREVVALAGTAWERVRTRLRAT